MPQSATNLTALLALVTSFFWVSGASADEGDAPRSNVLQVSLAYQVPTRLGKSVPAGGGIAYTRDYLVSKRVALGVNLGLRMFPAGPRHLALGYGLSIKHYIGSFGPTPSSGLYFLYGLMMQRNWIDGKEGSASGHDTKTAMGYAADSEGAAWLVELGYHLTQVRAFDRPTLWLPYADLIVGLRF